MQAAAFVPADKFCKFQCKQAGQGQRSQILNRHLFIFLTAVLISLFGTPTMRITSIVNNSIVTVSLKP
jgi:hypothetical protein